MAALDGLVPAADTAVEPREGRVLLFVKGRGISPEAVAHRLAERGVACTDLRVERGRLDEVFRTLTLAPEALA